MFANSDAAEQHLANCDLRFLEQRQHVHRRLVDIGHLEQPKWVRYRLPARLSLGCQRAKRHGLGPGLDHYHDLCGVDICHDHHVCGNDKLQSSRRWFQQLVAAYDCKRVCLYHFDKPSFQYALPNVERHVNGLCSEHFACSFTHCFGTIEPSFHDHHAQRVDCQPIYLDPRNWDL